MICAGIDAGSRAIKVVLFDSGAETMLASGVADQGVEQEKLARQLYGQVLADAGVGREGVARVVATGYGRNLIAFAGKTITEITCHAHGVRHLAPGARTIIDIGGQDSKVIHLDGDGNGGGRVRVRDFAMNDRCAAGTGRFLEIAAARLNVALADLGALASRSREPSVISSMCAVFAETEIVGLLASGAAPEDIAAGVQRSIAARVAAMAGRNLADPVVFTGGVALAPDMALALESALGHPVSVAPHPQMTGALGAAILAANT